MKFWNKAPAKKICISTIIDADTRIEGNIYCSTPLKIDGIVNGTVNATSEVVVARGATVNGDMFVNDVIISGIVNGDVLSNETVSLTESAKVNGNITTTGLVVDSGCKFDGNCQIVEKIDKPAPLDTPCEVDQAIEELKQNNEENEENKNEENNENKDEQNNDNHNDNHNENHN